jgi:hypothetical protein
MASSADAGDQSDAVFQDIPDILQRQPGHDTAHNSAKKRARGAFREEQKSTAGPLLPDDTWAGEEIRQRRRRLSIILASAALCLLSAAVVLAFVVDRNGRGAKTTENQLAQRRGENSSLDANEPDDGPDKTKVAEIGTAGEVQPIADTADQPIALDDMKGAGADHPPEGATADASSGIQPPVVDSKPTADGGLETHSQDTDGKTASDEPPPTTDEPANNGSPTILRSPLDDLIQKPFDPKQAVRVNFGDLADALESFETSISDINRLATISAGNRAIGFPKYFIPRPDAMDPRNWRRIDDPCPGAHFNQQSLMEAVAEISVITGLPICLDAESLNNAGFDFSVRLPELTLQDTDFRTVLETILRAVESSFADLKLKLEYGGQSPAVISTEVAGTIQEKSFALPELQEVSAADLTHRIKQLLSPDTFFPDNADYLLEVRDDHLYVRHHSQVVNWVGQFVSKWKVARRLKQGEPIADSLATRWESAAAARRHKLEYAIDREVPILRYLAGVQRLTSVTILIDFRAAIVEGWTPFTMIPTEIDEPDIESLIDELCHSMNLICRAVNANVFELTTNQSAAVQPELEFHNCTQILAGALNAEKLVEVVRQALQSWVNDPNVRIYYESEIDSFIAFAPQNVQRQLSAILGRLSKPNP